MTSAGPAKTFIHATMASRVKETAWPQRFSGEPSSSDVCSPALSIVAEVGSLLSFDTEGSGRLAGARSSIEVTAGRTVSDRSATDKGLASVWAALPELSATDVCLHKSGVGWRKDRPRNLNLVGDVRFRL